MIGDLYVPYQKNKLEDVNENVVSNLIEKNE